MVNNFWGDDLRKDLYGSQSKKVKENKISERGSIPMIWRDKILMRQKNKCAGKECAKIHNGKKLMVNNRSDFDHIKPLALGGKHELNNIQALCPGCHRLKTREDRYNISQKNKKTKSNPTSKKSNLQKALDRGFW